jgi:single-strand DNA-binding protein
MEQIQDIQDSPPQHRNEVWLVGRLADMPAMRELPSGDALVSWRLIVDRIPSEKSTKSRGGGRIDTLDCVSFRATIREAADGWRKGDIIEVQGSLRRRFWRRASIVASRYEGEAFQAQRLLTNQGNRDSAKEGAR